jgi:hypothetical protein
MIATTLVGYLPEALFTVVYFEVLVVILLPEMASGLVYFFGSMHAFVLSLMIKAWIEMLLLGVFMGALGGNIGFKDFMKQHFSAQSKRLQ